MKKDDFEFTICDFWNVWTREGFQVGEFGWRTRVAGWFLLPAFGKWCCTCSVLYFLNFESVGTHHKKELLQETSTRCGTVWQNGGFQKLVRFKVSVWWSVILRDPCQLSVLIFFPNGLICYLQLASNLSIPPEPLSNDSMDYFFTLQNPLPNDSMTSQDDFFTVQNRSQMIPWPTKTTFLPSRTAPKWFHDLPRRHFYPPEPLPNDSMTSQDDFFTLQNHSQMIPWPPKMTFLPSRTTPKWFHELPRRHFYPPEPLPNDSMTSQDDFFTLQNRSQMIPWPPKTTFLPSRTAPKWFHDLPRRLFYRPETAPKWFHDLPRRLFYRPEPLPNDSMTYQDDFFTVQNRSQMIPWPPKTTFLPSRTAPKWFHDLPRWLFYPPEPLPNDSMNFQDDIFTLQNHSQMIPWTSKDDFFTFQNHSQMIPWPPKTTFLPSKTTPKWFHELPRRLFYPPKPLPNDSMNSQDDFFTLQNHSQMIPWTPKTTFLPSKTTPEWFHELPRRLFYPPKPLPNDSMNSQDDFFTLQNHSQMIPWTPKTTFLPSKTTPKWFHELPRRLCYPPKPLPNDSMNSQDDFFTLQNHSQNDSMNSQDDFLLPTINTGNGGFIGASLVCAGWEGTRNSPPWPIVS